MFALLNRIFFKIIIAEIAASKHTPMEDPAITRTIVRRLSFGGESMMVGVPELVTDSVVVTELVTDSVVVTGFGVEASSVIKTYT